MTSERSGKLAKHLLPGFAVAVVGLVVWSLTGNRSDGDQQLPFEDLTSWELADTPGDVPGVQAYGMAFREADGSVRVTGRLSDLTNGGVACVELQGRYENGGERDQREVARRGQVVSLGGPANGFAFGESVESIWARGGVGDGDDCDEWGMFHRIW